MIQRNNSSVSSVALITGATRGIGRSIAEYFAEKKCRLALVYHSNQAEAKVTETNLQKKGAIILMIQADLTNYDSCRSVIKRTVEHFGQLDILVNNAGTTYDGAFAMMKPKEYYSLIRGNACAPILLSMYAFPHLADSAATGRNASIVMLSSMAGVTGKEGQVPYSATKGSVIGATRLLARSFGLHGIRVNALAPGFVRTDMVKKLDSKMFKHVLEASALSRMGEPHEVASAAWFLASNASSYISGQVHRIDGGFLR